jgi:hypothetical protein
VEKNELNVQTAFLEFSPRKLVKQYWPRLRGCVESLTDDQVWWRPNASNSIGDETHTRADNLSRRN